MVNKSLQKSLNKCINHVAFVSLTLGKRSDYNDEIDQAAKANMTTERVKWTSPEDNLVCLFVYLWIADCIESSDSIFCEFSKIRRHRFIGNVEKIVTEKMK